MSLPLSSLIPKSQSQSPKTEFTFAFPSLSFWHLQLLGWGGFFIFPLFVWLSHRAEVPQMWLFLTRPITGFLVTWAMRPVCQRLYQQRVKLFPLVMMMVTFSVIASIVELHFMIWLGRVLGFYSASQTTALLYPIFLTVRAVTLLFWFLLYFGIKAQRESAHLKLEIQEAEIKQLRSNVDPHFLFNALATIMAVRKEEEKVALVTQALADYLRFSLSQHQGNKKIFLHPLGEELEALKNYLGVEKVRFGENLLWHFEIGEGAEEFMVPSALVQPLLENAIKYGQLTSPKPLIITVAARIQERKLLLSVENTGSWETRVEPGASLGSGIANLERRLELLYRGAASLSFETSGDHVRAHLVIPTEIA